MFSPPNRLENSIEDRGQTDRVTALPVRDGHWLMTYDCDLDFQSQASYGNDTYTLHKLKFRSVGSKG